MFTKDDNACDSLHFDRNNDNFEVARHKGVRRQVLPPLHDDSSRGIAAEESIRRGRGQPAAAEQARRAIAKAIGEQAVNPGVGGAEGGGEVDVDERAARSPQVADREDDAGDETAEQDGRHEHLEADPQGGGLLGQLGVDCGEGEE